MMAIDSVKLGDLSVTRLIIGGNPFSGFSHQSPETDDEMRHYYTVERIKAALRQAEELGLSAHLSRADHHVMRYMMEYWDEGGKLLWLAQTCPEVGSIERGVDNAIAGNASACHIHGGLMDHLFANGQMDEIPSAIGRIRDAGIPAGIAGHNPRLFEWAEEHLDVDYYLCSYYNSAHRDQHAEHISGMKEWFLAEDRQIMADLIQQLSKPVVHYKVMAAGRNDPEEAFEFVARHLRPQDAVCVGIYTKQHPNGMAENLRLLEESLKHAAV